MIHKWKWGNKRGQNCSVVYFLLLCQHLRPKRTLNIKAWCWVERFSSSTFRTIQIDTRWSFRKVDPEFQAWSKFSDKLLLWNRPSVLEIALNSQRKVVRSLSMMSIFAMLTFFWFVKERHEEWDEPTKISSETFKCCKSNAICRWKLQTRRAPSFAWSFRIFWS